MGDLAFRVALLAGNSSSNKGFIGTYPSHAPNQSIQATQILIPPVYRANWEYLWAAFAVIVLTTISVISTFYGWWELGRTVSVRPLQIAKTFNSQLLSDVSSSRDIDAMLKELDGI